MRKVFFWLLLGYCFVQKSYAQVNGQQPGTSLNVCGATTTQGSVPGYNGGGLPGSCLAAGALNPFWYTFDMATSGTLGFTITPNNSNDDYDFALYDITGHSATDVYSDGSLLVSCNYSGYTGTTGITSGGSGNYNGANGSNQNALLSVVAGHTYALIVSHYTSSNQSGYTLAFAGGTATLAPPTPPKFASYTNICNKYLLIKTDRSIKCSTIAADGSDFVLQTGNRAVVSATGVGCGSSTFTNQIQVFLPTTLTSGTTYTLYSRTGSDGNSLQDVCGLNLDPTSTLSIPYTTAPPVIGDFTINDDVQCQPGNSFVFTNTSTVATGTLTYQWTTGDGGSFITQDVTRTYGSANNFTVTMIATSDRNCKDTVVKTVTVNPVKRTTENQTICITSLPYTWRGKTVTAGGATAARDTLPSLETGCDSIITLNLTVNPLKTASVNTTICEDQLPYTWHGQTVTVTGNSTLTFTTPSLITGCDSTTILNLTVNPFKTATETITICINQLPYAWNGQTITAGGTAVATDTRPSLVTGCDSTTTLDLVVNPLKTATINTTICEAQLPYTWHGQTVTVTGNTSLTFTTASLVTGCDSTTTLNLTVNPYKTRTIAQTICADQLPFTWNGQTVNTVGNTTLTYHTASLVTGCDSTTTLNLTVNPLKTAAQSITICADQLPYTWNGISVAAGGTGAATYHTPSLVTGCDSTTTLNLTVNPLKTATQTLTICANQLPYTWNGISVAAGGAGAATYHAPSLVTGCDSTTTLNLTVNPLKYATVNLTICESLLPYTWHGQVVNATGTTTLTYVRPSVVTGCDSTTTLNLTVNPFKTATVNLAICADQLPFTWNGQTVNTIGSTTLTYTTASLLTGCDSTTTLHLTVNPLKSAAVNLTICADQLPFVWHGQTVNTVGNTTLTYHTPSLVTGCDSTTTLHLTVNPLKTATVNLTICENLLPFHWNGQTVNTVGNTTLTYHAPSSVTGCDSTTTLHLIVNPFKRAVEAITICANQLPFTWNGQSVVAGGNGVATYTTPSRITGCDSTTTLNLTVNPLKFFTINMALCADQLPFTWNGQTVNAIGSTVLTYHTPSRITGCDSTTTLNLTVNPLKTATVNITICANQLPFVWNGQTVTTTGLSTLTYTTSSLITGCDSTTTLHLTVNTLPAVTTPPVPGVVTVGDNTTFTVVATGTGPLTYQWEINKGAGFTTLTNDAVYSNATSATLNITHAVYSMNGYQYRCVVSGICTPPAISNAAILTVNKKPQTISFQNLHAIAGTVTATYGDGQMDGSATATSGLSLNYSSNNTNVAAISGTGVIYLRNAGTATITITQAGDDEYLPALAITVVIQLNKKDLDVIAEDKTRPYGENNPYLTFHYEGFVNGDSKFVVAAPSISTTAILTSMPGVYPITLAGGSAANYNLILKNGTLTVTGAVVVVNQQPLNKAVCENGQTTFFTGASSHSQIVTISYQWQESADGVQWNDIAGETDRAYTAKGVATGYVRCMILAVGTAQPTNAARFTVYPLPYVRAIKANDLDCNTGSTQLNAYGANKFTWSPGIGLNDTTKANPIASPLKATKYVVTGTDVHGCANKDSVTVDILTIKVGENEVANAFTPNGDGRNDCFGIRFWGVVEKFELSIFNRIGVRVFHTNDPGQCWNGRYNGAEQPVGTYIYIIKAVNNCGPIERKGTLVLMR